MLHNESTRSGNRRGKNLGWAAAGIASGLVISAAWNASVMAQPPPPTTAASPVTEGTGGNVTVIVPGSDPRTVQPAPSADGKDGCVLRDWAAILNAIAWPAAAVVVVCLLGFVQGASQRIGEIFGIFQSVKLFGAELVLSEKGVRTAREAIPAYKKQVREAFDGWVAQGDLQAKLAAAMLDTSPLLQRLASVSGFRCTVHVPDVLFSDTLYQLLDYFPSGGGAGRTKSTRFGIIGKVWRSRQAELRGDVSTEPKRLISEWGMTPEEAVAAGTGRQSFACTPLQHERAAVAVVYMDAPARDAFTFTNGDEVAREVQTSFDSTKLTEAIAEMRKALLGKGPIIRIYDPIVRTYG